MSHYHHRCCAVIMHVNTSPSPSDLCDRTPPPTPARPGHHRDRPITYQALLGQEVYTFMWHVTRPTDRNVRTGLSRSRATNARRRNYGLGRHVLLFIILYIIVENNSVRRVAAAFSPEWERAGCAPRRPVD